MEGGALTGTASPPAASPPARASAARTNPWVGFLARRLARFAVSMALLLVATFAMVHALPGDPVRDALGQNAPAKAVEVQRHKLGLDEPITRQFVDYVGNVFSGDLGTSLVSGTPVSEIFSERLPATVELALVSFAVVLLVAIPLGIAIGIRTRGGRGRKLHLGFAATTGLMLSVPEYVLGVALVFLFAVTWKVLPVAGDEGPASFVLPVIALAIGPVAYLARIVRAETQRVLGEEYMLTARSKRLPSRRLYLRHALPNILTATLTVSGLILATLLAGTVLVETVFAWPGIGYELVQSVLATDFPVVQAVALFFGSAVLLINLAVDILIAIVDPRSTIRES